MNQAHDYNNHLPSKLRLALWKRIDRHLQKGEVLITNEQFFKVMDREFVRLVKVRPSPKIRQALYEMIVHVNDQYSDKYMAFGIRNAAFLGQRMPRLFPNMSAEETAAISEECEQVMAGIDAEREKSNKKDEMRVYRV